MIHVCTCEVWLEDVRGCVTRMWTLGAGLLPVVWVVGRAVSGVGVMGGEACLCACILSRWDTRGQDRSEDTRGELSLRGTPSGCTPPMWASPREMQEATGQGPTGAGDREES